MIINLISDLINSLINSIPSEYRLLINLLFYTVSIVLYSIFIWKFYRFLAHKDILQLNLKQYNYSNHPTLEKFFATTLYILEYIVILPFLVLFWFAILSIFLLFLSKSQTIQQILLISAAIIASTRITAYISEDLSKDLAKILPFTVLAMFILGEDFFNIDGLISKILEIPSLFNNLLMFIIFIFTIEFILRVVDSFIEFTRSSMQKEEK